MLSDRILDTVRVPPGKKIRLKDYSTGLPNDDRLVEVSKANLKERALAILEKNRKEPPPFLEVAVLEAGPIINKSKDISLVDIKLTKFRPSLAEVPSKELEALQERAINSGFDFIDFWSVDFDYKESEAFNHDWQDYRTRKDRSLKTTSEAKHVYANRGTYQACVKVVDVFGCDTSITVEVKV